MTLLLVPVWAPVITAVVLLFLPARVRRVFIGLSLVPVGAVAVALLAGMDLGGQVTVFASAFQQQTGVSFLSFSLHPIGGIALLGFTMVIPLGMLFGLEVSTKDQQAVALCALAGAAGVALADNFLTFLFFWEVLSITSATMIFLRRTEQAVKMAYRVLFLQLLGGLALTVGIVLHYHATGSFAMTAPAAGLPFFIAGIGVKAAFLPLHVWVPWGYPVAPFSASVLLAALCTKAGVFAVARILPASEGIALMGALMAIVAVSFALVQHDMRRLLSVHIVSQVGYMVAAIGLGNYYGVDGGLLHMANNMVYKALLFMCAGAVLYCTGTEDLHQLHHPPKGEEGPPLWRSLPLVTVGAVVGALAIAGTPLFNGYISKYLIKNASYGVEPVETILLVAGVGTALSFTKFIYFGFYKAQARVLRPPRTTMTVAIMISAAACVLFGVYPQALQVLLPHQTALNVYSLQGIFVSLQVIAVAVGVFALMKNILERGIHAPQWANGLAQIAAGTAHSAATGTVHLLDYITGGMQQLVSGAGDLSFKAIFRMFQKLDYQPGESRFFRFINVRNLEFDVMLVIVIFGVLAVWYLFMTLEIQIIHTNPF
ncbi:proton-conducting transporter transmembrane domain-containing protein [Dethiobacter alkaliphilus]|uniref:proton-conducting transporter transmembrane domain-containing protein n=1 Tax=Dethiobacter alkaliphilus TaxID=427926 RepID=UPI002225BF54|nr:proton-conducting transporter membrane subunit [Dethiobacter alkaliphilus]MCW3489176.1 proton-conducting transporter membrane subunit [Dethiobacter alkaliphilus]